jgi:peroxiredoxin
VGLIRGPMKITIFCLLFLFIAAGNAFAQETVNSEPKQEEVKSYTKVGKQMPAFTVKDLGGSEFKLDDLKGKVVVIYFWATWCPYCRDEMPALETEIWQKYRSVPDFAMIGIAFKQSSSEISDYLNINSLTFPMASDPKGEIFKLFANRGVPLNYVVGRDGKILLQSAGPDPNKFEAWKKLIDKELESIEKDRTGQ